MPATRRQVWTQPKGRANVLGTVKPNHVTEICDVKRSLRSTIAALLLLPGLAAAQENGRISGRVVDATSGTGIADVVVRIVDLSPALTNEDGVFTLMFVPPGTHQVTVEHLAYGAHVQTVEVRANAQSTVLIELSTEAIDLAEIVVETLSEREERQLTTGFSINEIGPEQIQEASRAGLNLAELLQSALPGVDARPSGGAVCVTYRAIRSGNSRGCDGVAVRIDGVPIADAAYVYQSMLLSDIERVEMLSPGQAGVRYGMRSGQGMLLIETRRADAERQRDLSRYISGFGWEEESEDYNWLGVFGSAAVVNAAGVGLSLLLADRCFRTPEGQPLAIRTSCGSLATAGTSLLSVTLPSITGTFAARWAGSTDRSRGRAVPSFVASAIVLTGGYLMLIGGDGASQTTGALVLAIGVPLTHTFADRALRILR